jgi:hypothetical protein
MEFSNYSNDDDQNVGLSDEEEEADEMTGFHETGDSEEDELDEEKIAEKDDSTDFDDDAAKDDV